MCGECFCLPEIHQLKLILKINSDANVEPGVTYRAGRVTNRARTFRKHRRPCGQPAVEGGLVRFRPVPAQAGHFARINAIPSDLPFKSTGFAIYPAPPQFGQSLGPNPFPPHVDTIVQQKSKKFATKRFSLRITNKAVCFSARSDFKFFKKSKRQHGGKPS